MENENTKHAFMTPKTQSVNCWRCGKPCQKSEQGTYMCDCTSTLFYPEPVAEPASTGDPKTCSCPCHKGESVICNCGGGFECEYINSIPAARPSGPSANFMQKIGGTCLKHGEYNGQQCPKWPDCISAAAPQPVSGDVPHMTLDEFAKKAGDSQRENYRMKLVQLRTEISTIEKLFPEFARDAQKVEEIARKLHLYHCQERRSGSMCPCHVIAEGMTEGCHCKEETADIAAILRPYFPLASQTPVNREELAAELFRRHRMRHNGRTRNQANLLSMWELLGAYERMEWLCTAADVQNILATPASTARTDALAKLRAEGWMVAVHNDYRVNGKFHTFWLLTRVGREGQFVKGEGETDEDALAQIVRQLAGDDKPEGK